MRRHFWLFNLLALVELITRPTMTAVIISLFAAMCVFTAELFNTAIELAVDLASSGKCHPLAGFAKDVAAGAVVMVAFGSLFIAMFVLVKAWPWRFELFSSTHLPGAVLVIIALIVVWLFRYWPLSRVRNIHNV